MPCFFSIQSYIPSLTKMRLDLVCNQMRIFHDKDYAFTFSEIMDLGIAELARRHQLHDFLSADKRELERKVEVDRG